MIINPKLILLSFSFLIWRCTINRKQHIVKFESEPNRKYNTPDWKRGWWPNLCEYIICVRIGRNWCVICDIICVLCGFNVIYLFKKFIKLLFITKCLFLYFRKNSFLIHFKCLAMLCWLFLIDNLLKFYRLSLLLEKMLIKNAQT